MGARLSSILVAEDDPEILDEVASALEATGATVTRAATGAELISHLGEDASFDVVVTDIAMPWMTGLQAMHSTRYAGLATPIVVITALRDETIDARVRALGNRAVLLRKPFSADDLIDAVTTVTGGAA